MHKLSGGRKYIVNETTLEQQSFFFITPTWILSAVMTLTSNTVGNCLLKSHSDEGNCHYSQVFQKRNHFLLWITTLDPIILRGQRNWHIVTERPLSGLASRTKLRKENCAFAVLFSSIISTFVTISLSLFQKWIFSEPYEKRKTHPVHNVECITEVS